MEKNTANKQAIVKVAIIGPESTGKSTLATALAGYYRTDWVPEYAREYLAGLERPYSREDLGKIAREQIRLEDEKSRKVKRILICDTNLLVIKIWSEHKYGQCDNWILDEINKRHYDLHLLTGIDIPWEKDPQREHPNMGKYFYDVYFNELTIRNSFFVEIKGIPKVRMESAVYAINALL